MTAYGISQWLTSEEKRRAALAEYVLDATGARRTGVSPLSPLLGRCPLGVALDLSDAIGASDVSRFLFKLGRTPKEDTAFWDARHFIADWDRQVIPTEELGAAFGI